jgi:hypothetical protein
MRLLLMTRDDQSDDQNTTQTTLRTTGDYLWQFMWRPVDDPGFFYDIWWFHLAIPFGDSIWRYLSPKVKVACLADSHGHEAQLHTSLSDVFSFGGRSFLWSSRTSQLTAGTIRTYHTWCPCDCVPCILSKPCFSKYLKINTTSFSHKNGCMHGQDSHDI